MKAIIAVISTLFIIFSAFSGGFVSGQKINEVEITSEDGSYVRLYAKENETSYVYESIKIKIITGENNSTALIYFNSILKDSIDFSYEVERSYRVNETTRSISVIVNNRTHKFNIEVLSNINLNSYISKERRHLKYTEEEVEEIVANVKISMLEKITIGFIIGFTIVAIFLIRRLRNEIQPVL